MKILYNIFNLVIAVAAVVTVLMGAATDAGIGRYFFISGLVLFGIASIMKLMAGLFYD